MELEDLGYAEIASNGTYDSDTYIYEITEGTTEEDLLVLDNILESLTIIERK